jgi:hypothetical protein
MTDLFTEFDGWLGEAQSRLASAWKDLEGRVGDISEELGATAGAWQARADAELARMRRCLDDLFGEGDDSPPAEAAGSEPEGGATSPDPSSGPPGANPT